MLSEREQLQRDRLERLAQSITKGRLPLKVFKDVPTGKYRIGTGFKPYTDSPYFSYEDAHTEAKVLNNFHGYGYVSEDVR